MNIEAKIADRKTEAEQKNFAKTVKRCVERFGKSSSYSYDGHSIENHVYTSDDLELSSSHEYAFGHTQLGVKWKGERVFSWYTPSGVEGYSPGEEWEAALTKLDKPFLDIDKERADTEAKNKRARWGL